VLTAVEITDDEVVTRVLTGETALFEIVMRRYNQRLYRVARSILRDSDEAEDVMQDAYVRAYEHLREFSGAAKFSTWLTKIAVYEALRRAKRRTRTPDLTSMELDSIMTNSASHSADPERQAYNDEVRVVLEHAIDGLPDAYRTVFILRVVEGLDVAKTAASLEIGTEAVKTRLHRARTMLRKELQRRAGTAMEHAFPFHLSRCDRVVNGVFRRILPTR
jgi:RNA polymerase sigma-70 factor, ECF subfamily